jgi:low affinity Fe/Cu permease
MSPHLRKSATSVRVGSPRIAPFPSFPSWSPATLFAAARALLGRALQAQRLRINGLREELVREAFRKFANATSTAVGSPWAFIAAAFIIVGWGLTGPLFRYSDTWQLVINTGTTIVTFLMVFLIQNTQNRDARAIHLKLDELLRAVAKARTGLVDLEELSDEELDGLHHEFQELRKQRSSGPPADEQTRSAAAAE